MRIRHSRTGVRIAAALALAAALLVPAWSVSVPKVQAAGAADAQASELVRLINGERAYRGKSTLGLDSFLAAKARDGAVWCPNDTSKVMAGRAKDIAVSGYFSHNLRLCTSYTIIDAMATWGYTRGRGEILTYNSGYGTAARTYTYGCSPGVTACPGSSTSTYFTTQRAMIGWMQSSVHYSIIVGSYDRVGCGAWVSSSGTYYYACLFAMGANPIVTPRPKITPKPPSGATPAPGASASPVASPTPQGPTQPPPWPTPSGASAWIILPSTEPDATPAADAGPSDAPGTVEPGAGAGLVPGGGPQGRAGAGGAGLPLAAELALTGGGLGATVLLLWLRLGPWRRYRARGTGG